MISATPETIALTVSQLAAAHTLARAHGHLWATTLDADALPATAEEIRAAVRAAHGDDIGIFYPDVQAYEYEGEPTVAFITHTTGSGRLQWIVDRDGDVEITVSRPDGGLFNFWVKFGDMSPNSVFVYDLAVECGLGRRHVDAAARALAALTGRSLDQSLSTLRCDGIVPCGPAHMAERVAEACWALAQRYVESPSELEHFFTWRSNAAELAAIVSMLCSRDHTRTDPTLPWVRAAETYADLAPMHAAFEEELAALPTTAQDSDAEQETDK